jgi:hypothetical protein
MVTHKTSTTRGVWRDQAAFQHVTEEYSIPPEVVVKGFDAILEWIKNSKGDLAFLAVGAALVAAMSEHNRELEAPKVGISVGASLAKRTLLLGFIPLGTNSYRGKVVNDQFAVVDDRSKQRSIPTAALQSLFRLDAQKHLFTYLDGTTLQAALLTDPVLFRTHTESFFPEPLLLQVRPASITHIEGKADSRFAQEGRSLPEILGRLGDGKP